MNIFVYLERLIITGFENNFERNVEIENKIFIGCALSIQHEGIISNIFELYIVYSMFNLLKSILFPILGNKYLYIKDHTDKIKCKF